MKKIAIFGWDNMDSIFDFIDDSLFLIDNQNPELVISFGGDGTFLDAVNKYGTAPVYFPINMGTLGFYTSWNTSDLKQLNTIIDDTSRYDILKAPLLDVKFYKNDLITVMHSINEITIINPQITQKLNVYINDNHFEKFSGTGMCVSTPTGSTGYNKSLQGAIIPPYIKAFQLTEIAGINNIKYRSINNSIILSESDKLSFIPLENNTFDHSVMTIDRQVNKLENCSKVDITLSNEHIKIAVQKNTLFWNRVKNAFLD